MSTPTLVDSFYSRIWNNGDLTASSELLSRDFYFRGSLGVEMRGHDAFGEYVRFVRTALADFRCEILDCVTEHNKAFAKMRFTGIHVGAFRGQTRSNPVPSCLPVTFPENWTDVHLTAQRP